MRRLTDGERDIIAELEADARELAESVWDEEQAEEDRDAAEREFYAWLQTLPELPASKPYTDDEINSFYEQAGNEPPY